MKFSTAKEHRDFFQKHGWIEFEGIVPHDQLAIIQKAMDDVLAQRLSVAPERLSILSSEKLYVDGHDLWRSNSFLQRFVSQVRFAEIASELIEAKPLRLGCDQFFPSRQQKPFSEESRHIYSRFLEETAPLQLLSCLKGIACGVMICLGGKGEGERSEVASTEGVDIFPSSPGHVIFFQPNALVNWNQFYSHLGQKFYLVVYTFVHANYQLEPRDPHTHFLKRFGYILNDKLNDKLHPIIYR
ncbi:MAG: hypothetical protein ACH350_07025 [Parachlamydiaceae bacterium]